jgi:hypothetical protein
LSGFLNYTSKDVVSGSFHRDLIRAYTRNPDDPFTGDTSPRAQNVTVPVSDDSGHGQQTDIAFEDSTRPATCTCNTGNPSFV